MLIGPNGVSVKTDHSTGCLCTGTGGWGRGGDMRLRWGRTPGGGTSRPAALPSLEGGIRTGHGGSPSRGVHGHMALLGLEGDVKHRQPPWQRPVQDCSAAQPRGQGGGKREGGGVHIRMGVEPWWRALSIPALRSEGAERKEEQMGS